MFLARIITRILWAAGYPSFAPLSGEYQVGAIQTRLPDSIACQIHYPAEAEDAVTTKQRQKKGDFVPYFRPQAVEGMANYSQISPAMLRALSLKRHPCLMNADPFSSSQKFPMVLFSHGLGGTMEMYTQLCQQIASYGFVVVALEHEDGSAAYAETSLGKPIYFKRPSNDIPYSRQSLLNFRTPFHEQRVQETTKVLDILLNHHHHHHQSTTYSDGTTQSATIRPEVQKILNVVDTSKGISFVGHSFGGATLILAAQKYMSEAATTSNSDEKQRKNLFVPKSLSLLDVWAFSIEDQALNRGVDLPVLSIISEAWVLKNPEVRQVDQFLQNCPNNKVSSFYISRSSHASFSDAASWLPRFIGSKLYLNGKKEKPYETIPTAAKACVERIQSALLDNNNDNNGDATNPQPIATSELLQVYDYNTDQEKAAAKTATNITAGTTN